MGIIAVVVATVVVNTLMIDSLSTLIVAADNASITRMNVRQALQGYKDNGVEPERTGSEGTRKKPSLNQLEGSQLKGKSSDHEPRQ